MNIGTSLEGNRYGYLTAIKINGKCKKGYTYECKCDCGNTITVKRYELVRGHKKSCGCKTKEMIGDSKNNHDLSHTRLYRIYSGMIFRCSNEKSISYTHYGKKGIKICPEWLGKNGFKNFSEWAYKNGYTNNLTIDRIDNALDYSPANCRWTTQKVQQNNRTNNHVITFDDKSMTISQWAEYLNVPIHAIRNRLKRGRTDAEAIKELYEC